MRQEVFELPSKAKIEFRQIKLAEENLLAAAMKERRVTIDSVISDILSACAVGVVDAGPYDFLSVGGKPKWDSMARADRFQAMVDLRCISYKEGHVFEADLRCPAMTCGHRFGWEIDLKTDLLRVPMPEESVAAVREGRPFEVTIDNRVVKFTMALGKTEQTYNALLEQHEDRDMACALRSRIVEVEDLRPHEIMDWLDGGRGDKFEGLTSEDAEEMREAFDVVEGGIDTALEAKCPRCKEYFDFDLPFSGMLLPGSGIAKRRRQARRKQTGKSSRSEDSTPTT